MRQPCLFLRKTLFSTVRLGVVLGLLGLISLAMPAARAQVQVTVNDVPVVFRGQPPIERGGRVLVPLRGVMERLGAFVRYESLTRTVTAYRGATNITLPVGSRRALIGDRAVTLEAPATVVNSSVLVPLRFVAEALGARVRYQPSTRTVAIAATGDGVTAPGGAPPRGGINGGVIRAPSETAPTEAARGMMGTVVAVYPDLAPRRIVVRVASARTPGGGAMPANEVTIPLRPDAKVAVRRPNTLLEIELERVRIGDQVEVRRTREGVATFVEVTARADVNNGGGAPPFSPPKPRPVPPSSPPVLPDPVPAPTVPVPPPPNETPPATATDTPPGPAERSINGFKGEFLEANRIKKGAYVLKMTDGRLIEVPGSVLVLYGSKKIGLDDLRSGDQLTIAVDPKTKRGTRIVVAVEQYEGPKQDKP